MTEPLTVLYRDHQLLAVNKPAGLLMHPSPLAPRETDTLVSRIRQQFGEQTVHTIHRLDRPTSGVVVLARSKEVARELGLAFTERDVQKSYLAIARGFTTAEFDCQIALREELDDLADRKAQKDKPAQTAETQFRRLARAEVGIPVSRYPKARFSLLQCVPNTGRKHQIRRHLKKLRHPIIGDTRHGDRHHNHWAWAHFPLTTLALHAQAISFSHPLHGQTITIEAPLPGAWVQAMQWLGWSESARRFAPSPKEDQHARL